MANIYLPNRPLCDNTLINILNNNANSLETKINKINEYLKPLNYHIELDSSNDESWDIKVDVNKCLVFSNKTTTRLLIHFHFISLVQKKPVYSNLYLKSPNIDSLILASFGYGILEDGIPFSVLENSDKKIPFKEYTYTLPFEDSYLWKDEPLSKFGAYNYNYIPTDKINNYTNLKKFPSTWNNTKHVFGGFTKYKIQDNKCINGFVDLETAHQGEFGTYHTEDKIADYYDNDFLNIIDTYPILLATNINHQGIMNNATLFYLNSQPRPDRPGLTYFSIITDDYETRITPTNDYIYIYYQKPLEIENTTIPTIKGNNLTSKLEYKEYQSRDLKTNDTISSKKASFDSYKYNYDITLQYTEGKWYRIKADDLNSGETTSIEETIIKYNLQPLNESELPNWINYKDIVKTTNSDNLSSVLNYWDQKAASKEDFWTFQYNLGNTYGTYKTHYIDVYHPHNNNEWNAIDWPNNFTNSNILSWNLNFKLQNIPMFSSNILLDSFWKNILNVTNKDLQLYKRNQCWLLEGYRYSGLSTVGRVITAIDNQDRESFSQDYFDLHTHNSSALTVDIDNFLRFNTEEESITLDNNNLQWQTFNNFTHIAFWSKIRNVSKQGFYAVFIQNASGSCQYTRTKI